MPGARRFGNSTPESIRESHEIVRQVMAGEVTPHCQRAQTAFRVARRYPLWTIGDEPVPPGVESGRAPSPRRPSLPPSARRPTPRPSAADDRDREAVLQVLFGELTPHLRKAAGHFNHVTGGRGGQIAGVAGVALLPLVISKVSNQ